MSQVEDLILHLLKQKHSVDTVDDIIKELKISPNQLDRILSDEKYKDYFQSLSPNPNEPEAVKKIILTLNVSSVT